MDNLHRQNNAVEPAAGGYGSDAAARISQSHTTTAALSKPQQRAPEFGARQPRPEFYQPQQQQPQQQQQQPQQQQQQQQGPYGAPNRPPPGQQQQRPPPPQQQQPRTPGERVSPWNLIRQTLPPEIIARGPSQQQFQRPPPPPQQQQQQQQYYNMQQRPQQPVTPMQERRPTLSRNEDRQPFRPENGRPTAVSRPVNDDDDDEEVVVNAPNNQQPAQQPPPPLNRRDSALLGGGGRAPETPGDPNRQWQRPGAGAVPPYGKPPYQQSMVIPEGQEQRYPPQPAAVAAGNYNRQQLQDDDNGRRPKDGQKGPRDAAAPLTRRDSVLEANLKATADASSRRNEGPVEYVRRPVAPSEIPQQDDSGGGRRPLDLQGGKRPPLPPSPDVQEDSRRAPEHKKTAEQEDAGGNRRPSDHRNRPAGADQGAAGAAVKSVASRPDANKDGGSTARDDEQQQQQQQPRAYEQRKTSLEKEPAGPKAAAVEHGNRASELRKAHFEATHLKPVKEQTQFSKAAASDGGASPSGRDPPKAAGDTKYKDYATVAATRPKDGNETDSDPTRTPPDNADDPPFISQSKNARPDTLKIIKDNEPFKDSSNTKSYYRGDDPGKSPSKIPKKDRSELKTPTRAVTPKSPESVQMSATGQKKLPMNKVQVGAAPSPNLKVVRSKVGSLQNTSYKPGGGQVKIENRKLEWKAGTRVVAKNDTYVPGGGDKKIQSVKLQWNAKPKVGSLENKTHKPGGGDKKIETVKLDFKDKAKPKIGSKDNIKHTPGGGTVKIIEDQKLEIKAQSKIGSLDNVKHKPGGGEVKIFDDKSYIKQTAAQIGTPTKSQLRRSSSMKSPVGMKSYSLDERPKSQVKIVVTPTSDEDLNTKIGTNVGSGGLRRSANSRSPSLQNNIVIPEEAVRSKK